MIFSISWKNLWRNKLRSFVIIGAIMLGVWAIIYLVAFMQGMMYGFINNTIKTQHSHIQIHDPLFPEDQDAEFIINDGSSLVSNLKQSGNYEGVTGRCVANGLIASAKANKGVKIAGIIPSDEQNVTGLKDRLVEGTYFETKKRKPILISKKMLETLHVKMGSKVVLTFPDKNGDLVSGAFRVIGIFNSNNSMYDLAHVFVKTKDIASLQGHGNSSIHEIAITLPPNTAVDSLGNQLKNTRADLKVRTWKEIAPELELWTSQANVSKTIIMVIVLLALTFGLINTMLMAVLERTRELGMLKAIGMNKTMIFSMIVLETVLLALIGGLIGTGFGAFMINQQAENGLDLSNFSEGLDAYGMQQVIYPFLEMDTYITLGLMVVCTAILAAIYPAIKALKLKPVVALRKL